MRTTKYEVVDDNIISKLSLKQGCGLLALVDAEADKDTETAKSSGYEDITRFILGLLGEAVTPKPQKIDDGFEKYKKQHPDDPMPMGSYVLEAL